MLIKSKKVGIIAASAALSLGVSGVAFAYFTGTGSGAGNASVGSASWWNVTSPNPAVGIVYPGVGSSVVTFKVQNLGNNDGLNGGGYQAIESVNVSTAINASGGAVTSGSTAVPGCLAAWFHASAAAPSLGYGHSLAVNSWDTIAVTVTMDDSLTNQDKCKGVTPDVKLAIVPTP
jgi:hypothetical protein